MEIAFNELEKLSGLHLGDHKVLLVEDDPVTRWMVRLALKGECLLATACDAGKAISSYLAYKPDMVLLDINLPDRNGKDLIQYLLRIDPGAHIIMFSSQNTPEAVEDSLRQGAKGFIAKPFNRDELLRYIARCPNVS
jgi:two-component system chemotaxis response regulator CheY